MEKLIVLSNRRKLEILRTLERENGAILADDVVEYARSEDSELHSEFEWNDAVAAEKHRLTQARQLIRAAGLRVIHSSVKLDVPAYVKDVTSEVRGAYRRIDVVRNEEELARATLIAAMSRVTGAAARAKSLARYFNLEDEVQNITSLAEAVMRTISADDPPGGEA